MQPGSRPDREVEGAPAVSAATRTYAAGEPCALCRGTRRTYLFVVGPSRMTRCDECQLVFRSDDGRPVEAESYALDDDSGRAIRSMLAPAATSARRKVLCIADKGGPGALLHEDPRLDVTVVTGQEVLSSVQHATFDAAFVNGAIEHADPLALLRRVRAALRPGGDLVIVVGDDAAIRGARLPRYAFSAVALTRATLAAGFRPRSCGILSRSVDTPVRDERLANEVVPFERAARLAETVGKRVEVPSGLLAMHARAEAAPARPKLSIIMPVFNEGRTFEDTFERVYGAHVAGVEREIVIVESNSTDGSRELVQKVEHRPGVTVIYEERPQGKGHAVRAAIAASTGDFVLIQDADSEYDVGDYDIVLEPLLTLSATFVLGSRHMGGRTWKIRQFANQRLLAYVMNLAHESFTAIANGLYGTEMRDPTTMYKVFRRDAYEGIRFTRDRFDFDWELVCKLVRRGHVPIEVPVNYRSRSYAEGKKVRFFRDPLTWLETIVASRFEPLGEDDR
ncbi:MAG TPA: glycosyltransferase [Polyangiaceae bacterium]|jgi:SAM-dependent methyltransferase